MPRALPYTISKDGRVVSRRSELQGHRVRLPGADMVIAPAGHHDHHRAAQRIGHGLGSVPQIDGQTPAAGGAGIVPDAWRFLLVFPLLLAERMWFAPAHYSALTKRSKASLK